MDNIEREKNGKFPALCPICGKKEAHIYFHKYKDNNKGGMWVWCSACKHSAHAMYKMPEWWCNLEKIQIDRLFNYPNYLELNKQSLDEWINDLLNKKIK